MEGIPYTPESKDDLPALRVSFPDYSHTQLVDMLKGGRYLCFSVAEDGTIYVTGKEHKTLEESHGLDNAHALVKGVVMLRTEGIVTQFYGDSLRKTLIQQSDKGRVQLEAGVTESLTETFGSAD